MICISEAFLQRIGMTVADIDQLRELYARGTQPVAIAPGTTFPYVERAAAMAIVVARLMVEPEPREILLVGLTQDAPAARLGTVTVLCVDRAGAAVAPTSRQASALHGTLRGMPGTEVIRAALLPYLDLVTNTPVTTDGWYEHTDRTFGFYVGAGRPGGPHMTSGPCTAHECVQRDDRGRIYAIGWPARPILSEIAGFELSDLDSDAADAALRKLQHVSSP